MLLAIQMSTYNICFDQENQKQKHINITKANQWHAIAYPRASAIPYLRAHQNSKCIPSVLIHRAITCDSFMVLAQKWLELCDNPKKYPKSYFLTSSDPQTCPRGNIFAPLYSTLTSFNLICNVHDYVQNGFLTLQGHTPLALPPGVT